MGFVTVGKAIEILAGEMAAFNVEGNRVAVANVDDTLYGFSDVCTHRQCPLAKGELDGTTVTCPCHGSQFDVTTGAVLSPPAVEPVATFPVRIEADALQIDI
jgi:3-phenylpropionate/trans-cinnamate dioxygenase ferredoxin subunit